MLKTIWRIVSWPVTWLPPRLLARLLVAARRARSLPPAEGLRFLFDMDARLYPLQGELAIAYEGGIHTKHRHMRYHDFFVTRILPGEKVLDIGCGIGAVAHSIAERTGAQVTGIDYNAKSIATARERYAHPGLTFIVGDALKDLPGQQFDVVILSNVLEHIDDRPGLLRQIAAQIRPSRLLIRVPLFERDWRVPLKQELGVEWRLDADHRLEYTLETFRAEMDSAGMAIQHLEVRWGEIWAEVKPKDVA